MLLNFQKRFVPFIITGSKTHTIRADRKRTPRPGEICHCYTGLRHKGALLLGRWECVKVERIRFNAPQEYHWTEVEVRIDGELIYRSGCNLLAVRDGFTDWKENGCSCAFEWMMRFWEGRLPFYGHVIHWHWRKGTALPSSLADRRRHKRRPVTLRDKQSKGDPGC